MRRYAIVSVVLLMVAVFVAAWVNAQEGSRRRSIRVSGGDVYGGDFSPGPELNAPRQLQVIDEATPIDGELSLEPSPARDDMAVLPTAGPIDEEPTEADVLSAHPSLRGGSRLGPTVLPASPVAEPPPSNGDITGDSSAASMPSVLKKKAGSPPSAATIQSREPRLTPTTIDAGNEPSSIGSSSRRAMPANRPMSIRSIQGTTPKATASATPPAAEPAPQAEAQMLQIKGTMPQLVVEAVGPQAVTIGKPAAYQVQLSNEAGVGAENVEVRVGLPAWVQVEGGEGTRGEAKQEADATGRQWLVWTLPDLAGGGKEQLTLQLVARQNQPFQLALHCDTKPATIAGEVAVREPQVQVRLAGPSDMLFGEQKTFTLHVSNPGTGDAENVAVEVSSGGQPNRLEVGTLAAGQQKEIPFSVSAIAPGEMEIRAVATGANGLTAEAASRVNVHKPELQVAVNVPPLSFAGSESIFQVVVANVGDAIAEQVVLGIALPPGAKYLGGVDGATAAANGLTLKMGNLAPNSEKVFEVRCVLMQSGEQRIEATAQGQDELLATQVASTHVEALADLKLTVNEPKGPVAVGGETVYEVRLTNRGTKSAEKVKVVVQFAKGIEPFEVVGGTANVANGQALFEPIAEVPAGQEVVLKVKAKTENAGNHAFRVEVKAGEPETKLVSEGITRCFADIGTFRATARKPGPLQPAPATKIR